MKWLMGLYNKWAAHCSASPYMWLLFLSVDFMQPAMQLRSQRQLLICVSRTLFWFRYFNYYVFITELRRVQIIIVLPRMHQTALTYVPIRIYLLPWWNILKVSSARQFCVCKTPTTVQKRIGHRSQDRPYKKDRTQNVQKWQKASASCAAPASCAGRFSGERKDDLNEEQQNEVLIISTIHQVRSEVFGGFTAHRTRGYAEQSSSCNVWRVICSSKHRTLINECCTLKDRDSFTLLLNYLIILRQAFYMEKHYTDKISLQGTQLQIKPRKEGFQVKTGKLKLYIFPNRSKCVVESPCECNTRIFGFSSQCISCGMTY